MTNEYEDYEHGDYSVVVTPENVDKLAQAIEESNPNYPTYVFYNFAKTVYFEEMPFSVFMDRLDQALEDEIENTMRQMVLEGKADISMDDEGNIGIEWPSIKEEDSTESE